MPLPITPWPFAHVDHFVFAGPDLEEAVQTVERVLGVSLTPGGVHVGLGTRNYLLPLGGTTYLEVIGPDPEQPTPKNPRPFGIDDLEVARLVTWASPSGSLDALVTKAKSEGVDLGAAFDMSRRTPEGLLLSWRLTMRAWRRAVEPIPFFIDWGETPSPAKTLDGGPVLSSFEIYDPQAEEVRGGLSTLGLPVDVYSASTPELVIHIETEKGLVRLS